MYQGRVSLSPAVEEQYKAVDARLRQRAEDLSGPAGQEERGRSDGEDDQPVRGRADVSAESRPTCRTRRVSRTACCLPAAGWAQDWRLGLGLAMWLELRDNSIRTEADAEAALELPMLVAVPWVGVAAAETRQEWQIQVLESEQESGRAQDRR